MLYMLKIVLHWRWPKSKCRNVCNYLFFSLNILSALTTSLGVLSFIPVSLILWIFEPNLKFYYNLISTFFPSLTELIDIVYDHLAWFHDASIRFIRQTLETRDQRLQSRSTSRQVENLESRFAHDRVFSAQRSLSLHRSVADSLWIWSGRCTIRSCTSTKR